MSDPDIVILNNSDTFTVVPGPGLGPPGPTGSSIVASLPSGGTPGATLITVNTSDSSTYGAFQLAGLTNNGDNPDGRPDHVMSMGWNIGANSAPLVHGQPACRIGWESHFDENGVAGNPTFEMHFGSFFNPAGTEYRFLTGNFNYLTNSIKYNFNADRLVFQDSSQGNEYMLWQPNGSTAGLGAQMFLIGNTKIFAGNNNYAPFVQNNADASAYLNLPYYDSSNIMQLGPSVGQVAAWGTAGVAAYTLTGTGTPANGQLGWQISFGTVTSATLIGLTVLGSTNFEIKNQTYNSGAGNAVDELLVPTGHAAFVRSAVFGGQAWAAGMNTSSNYEIAAGSQPGGSTAFTIDKTTQVTTFSQSPSIPTATPSSASAAGIAGQVAWDASFIYICVATNTWKRAAIATW